MAEEIISIDDKNPSNPPQSEGEPLPVSPSNLVQALVADKDALSALTNALASALGPLIHSHARDQGDKDSESDIYTEPAVPVGQSGVEAQQSINAHPVATENNNKRTCEESQDDCVEIRAVKRPRAMTSTDIEGDHDELEESDLILAPNSRWEASENLKELINASIQPLKRFERRAIKKEFPRPNVDAAYTPNLDSYLVPLIAGIKSPDESLRDVQDKICDVFGPLGVMYENLLPLVSAAESGEEVTLDHHAVTAFMNCVKKSIILVGDMSAIFTTQRRAQVLTKLNPSLASLGKEQFPEAGKQLFGEGFEDRLKTRSETAWTVAAAHNAGKSFFPKTASRGWRGHRAGSFSQNQPRQYSPRFQTRFTFNRNPSRFQSPRFQTARNRGRGRAYFPRYSAPSQS